MYRDDLAMLCLPKAVPLWVVMMMHPSQLLWDANELTRCLKAVHGWAESLMKSTELRSAQKEWRKDRSMEESSMEEEIVSVLWTALLRPLRVLKKKMVGRWCSSTHTCLALDQSIINTSWVCYESQLSTWASFGSTIAPLCGATSSKTSSVRAYVQDGPILIIALIQGHQSPYQ